MAGRRHGARGLSTVLLLGCMAVASGCEEQEELLGDGPGEAASEEFASSDAPEGQLAQLHLRVHHPTETSASATLEAQARFVHFQALSDQEARLRANVVPADMDRLGVGECVVDSTPELGFDPSRASGRSLELIDAGPIAVAIGGYRADLAYNLVPDLLPWVSGLSYFLHVEGVATAALEAPDAQAVEFATEASPELGLGALELRAELPPRLSFVDARLDATHLHLNWRPPSEASWPLVLRLRSESVDVEHPTVLCSVDDRGEASLSLSALESAGFEVGTLAPGANLFLEATRIDRQEVAAPGLDALELLVERRESQSLSISGEG